jgi:hypothetical protein
LRIVIAEACVKSYTWSLQLGGRNGSSKGQFRFQREMDTLDGFASDVARVFTKSIRGNKSLVDPLSKKSLDHPDHLTTLMRYVLHNFWKSWRNLPVEASPGHADTTMMSKEIMMIRLLVNDVILSCCLHIWFRLQGCERVGQKIQRLLF